MLKRLEAEFARALAADDVERADAIATAAMVLRDVRKAHPSMLLLFLDDVEGMSDEFLREIAGVLFDFGDTAGTPVFVVIDFRRIVRVSLNVRAGEALLFYLGSTLGQESVALVTHDDA